MSAAEVVEGKTPDSEIAGTQRRKHRHDLGHEDHGPVVATGTTRGIQALLGLWIALTMILVVYALVDGSRPKRDTSGMSAPLPGASPGSLHTGGATTVAPR